MMATDLRGPVSCVLGVMSGVFCCEGLKSTGGQKSLL